MDKSKNILRSDIYSLVLYKLDQLGGKNSRMSLLDLILHIRMSTSLHINTPNNQRPKENYDCHWLVAFLMKKTKWVLGDEGEKVQIKLTYKIMTWMRVSMIIEAANGIHINRNDYLSV